MARPKTAVLILMLILVSSICIQPAFARWHLDRRDFKSDYQLGAFDLKLRGVGVKTLFMMRLFVAAFYVMPETSMADVLSDVPKHLQVTFYTSIPTWLGSRPIDNILKKQVLGLDRIGN